MAMNHPMRLSLKRRRKKTHALRMTWKCGTHDVVVTRFLTRCTLQNEVDAEEVGAEVVDSQHRPVRNSGYFENDMEVWNS